MAMQLAAVQVDVTADLSKLAAGLSQVQSLLTGANKELTNFTKNTDNLKKGVDNVGGSLKNTNNAMKDTAGSSGNLGRFFRELTTSMLGTNVATIALGTALGNVATQIVSRLLLAVVDSIAQFGRLRNELASTAATLTDVGGNFQLVSQMAAVSGRSLEETTRQFISLATEARNTGGSIEVARRAFVDWNETLGRNRQQTIMGSLGQVGTSFGNVVTRIDSALGSSQGLVNAFTSLVVVLNKIASALPKVETPLETAERRFRAMNSIMEQIGRGQFPEMMTTFGSRAMTAAERIQFTNDALRDMARAAADLEQFRQPQAMDPAVVLRRATAMQELNLQYEHELSIARLTRQEQEERNRLFAIEMEFRRMGAPLNETERDRIAAQTRFSVAAGRLNEIRESLRSEAQIESENYQLRIQSLRDYYTAIGEVTAGGRVLMQQEEQRHQNELTLIELRHQGIRLNAASAAGQAGVELFQTLGQKNKAFALAALALGKAVAIAQVIHNTTAAAAAALAPPPLGAGPIAGAPLAASIKAWGAVQVALIAATGLAQGAMTLSGGGPTGGSGGGGNQAGGGGQAQPVAPEENAGGRSVEVLIKPGDIWSAGMVQGLIERLNAEVASGATLITSKFKQT